MEYDDEDKDLDKMLYEMIEKSGTPVLINTKECILWQNEHPNCFDCPGKIGCDKFLLSKMLFVKLLMYSPKNFQDFLAMDKYMNEMRRRIMQAKNQEELDKIAKEL